MTILLNILLLPILILLISIIELILLLLLLRHHLLLLLLIIILYSYLVLLIRKPPHHLHFEPLFFHEELILCDLLVDLGFEVLFFAVDKSHVIVFLHQVHIVNIKCFNLINIHLRVLLQIIIKLLILAVDILVNIEIRELVH